MHMDAKEWKEKVLYSPKNGYDRITEARRRDMEDY